MGLRQGGVPAQTIAPGTLRRVEGAVKETGAVDLP